ncbi:hypothetical protein N7489_003621 [Penicillium chrysogenum]|uniref:uncharacterized protein n=1 Tax=Penicillium chrysogenum TaxID=5076 RepID=UPI0024DF2726|nr:uncharacterized protein N7489_003621 [Penicillium chrysogenum]KAJ5253211.1 hypothetical protein N7489_003621 [Penicillium chrysogenum]
MSASETSPTVRPAPGSLGKRTVAEVLGSLSLEISPPQKARSQDRPGSGTFGYRSLKLRVRLANCGT